VFTQDGLQQRIADPSNQVEKEFESKPDTMSARSMVSGR
jgi:hypothetical protein